MDELSRREFGKRAVAAGIATALGGARVQGANDRIRVGFIGVGNRGDQVLDGFLPHSPSVPFLAIEATPIARVIGKNPQNLSAFYSQEGMVAVSVFRVDFGRPRE